MDPFRLVIVTVGLILVVTASLAMGFGTTRVKASDKAVEDSQRRCSVFGTVAVSSAASLICSDIPSLWSVCTSARTASASVQAHTGDG